MKKTHPKAIAIALCAFVSAPLIAQTSTTPTIIGDRTSTYTLSTDSDNYEVSAGTLIKTTSGNGISGGTATSRWFVKNSGTVDGQNSGLYFSYDATVTNLASGFIKANNTTASHAGIYFTSAAAGSVTNSGTVLGGLKGIAFANTARTSSVINHAGTLIQTSVNATNGGAIYTNNNVTISATNYGMIDGALRGLHFGGASTVYNSGTVIGGSGVAIQFNSTAESTLTLDTGSVINGNIISITARTNKLILNGSGSEDSNFLGMTSTTVDAAKGFASITMSGIDWTLSGTVQLSGNNADTIKIDAGRLTIAGETVFDDTNGAMTIATGGTLQLGNGGASGSLFNNQLSGPPAIANDGVFAINRSDNYTFSGDVSGDGVITQAGSGVLSLTGNNTHGSGVRVDSGTLAIADDSKLGASTGGMEINGGVLRYDATITSARDLVITADSAIDTNGNAITLSGGVSGAGALTKTGAGLLELTGANTATGATTIESGTLQGNIGSGLLTVNTGATYKVSNGTIDAVLGNIAGAGAVDLNNANLVFNVATGTQTYGFAGTLQNGGNLVKTGAGKLDIGSHSFAGELNASGTTIVGDGTLKFDNASQLGANLVLGGDITTGLIETDFSAWTQNLALVGAGGGVSIASGSQALTVTVAGSGDFVKGGEGTLDITGATMNQSGNTQVLDGKLVASLATLNGNTAIATGATLELDQAADDTYSGVISGGGSLIKEGAGNVTLTGANSYTGDTTVNAGMLTGNIGAGQLTVNDNATYKVADGVTNFSLSGILGTGTVNLNTANLTFDVADDTTSVFNFTGALTGGNQLIKTGGGTIDIQTAAVLTNGVAVKNGAIKLADQNYVNAPITLGDTATSGMIEYTGAAAWNRAVSLTGAGGGFTVSSGSQTLAAGAAISGAGDFVKGGAGALDITTAAMTNTGNTRIDGGKLIANLDTLKGNTTIAGGATLELNQSTNGAYSNVISGGGSLIKNGAGEVTLTGANTYAGDTTINAGTLSGNIGAGQLTVNAGATYKVADGETDFQLSGILGSGTVNLNAANLTLDVASGDTSQFNFTGALTGGNQLIKTGGGAVELQTAAALTNGVVIKNGTLKLANQSFINAPVVLGDTATSGLIEYTGATAWNLALSLAGAGGGFTVSSGTQALAAGTAISGAGDFVKGGAGALDITTAAMTNTGNTRINGGKLIANTDTLKGNTTIDAGAVVEFNQTGDGVYSGIISGGGSLIKNGSSEVILTGNNIYGDTTVNAGTLSGNIGVGTLTVNTGATYKVADGETNFALSGVLGAGTVNLNAANLTLDVASGTNVFNFTGVLTGGNQLVKTGAGVIELQTAAALTNGVSVKNGTLKLVNLSFINAPVTLGDTTTAGMIEYTGATNWNKNIALTGAGGGFIVASGTQTLAAIELTGAGNFVKTGDGALDITAATVNSPGGNTLVQGGHLIGTASTIKGDTILSAGTTLEFKQTVDGVYAGNISGTGALVKTGDGTLTLTGLQTQIGAISILAGALAGNISGLQSDITIAASTAMIFDQAADSVFSGAVHGAGALVKTGAGKLTLTGANNHTGGTRILEGAIEANTSTLSGDIENNATLIFNQAVAGAYAGGITGTGQLQKIGGGTLTLSGGNNYSGNTLITEGALRASAANKLSAASRHVVFGSRATLDLGNYNQTIAGLDNTGTVILNATINPDVGVIISSNRLDIAGDATGDGKLLIRITENTGTNAGIGAGTTQRVLVKIYGDNASNYTGELDKRYVDGAYEWGVVLGADGQSYDLKAGLLSPEIPAAVSIPAVAQLMAKAGIDTLTQRLGDMRDDSTDNAGFWFRGIYREDRIEDSLLDGLKVRTAGGQAGVFRSHNGVFSPKGRLDYGILLTIVTADARFKRAADLTGDAKEVGAFVTYRLDSWYADLVLNAAYNKYRLKMRDGSDSFDTKGWSPAAVLEIGKRLRTPLGTIEPQIQIAYQHCQIDDTFDAFARNYTFDSAEMLNTHAGLRWHKVYAKADSSSAIIPTLRMRYGYEHFGKSQIQVSDTEFENKLRGSQISIDGGFTWWLNRHTGVYANAEWATGNALDSFAATAGVRVSW